MHSDFSVRNKFVSPTYERLALKRGDDDWRRAALSDPASKIMPVWCSKAPLGDDDNIAWLTPDRFAPELLDNAVLLGEADGKPCFAVDMGVLAPPELPAAARFENLRSVGALADASNAALAAYGLAMAFWHRRSRFCGHCGSPTRTRECGHVVICTSELCGNKEFPRSDPAVIVLVTRDDKALLGRQAHWPAGTYSTLAGFVEPGESLEHAVRREVAEESGVLIDTVRYHASQPWPFPASLMLGFFANATNSETTCHDNELEDVRWFSREDIIAQLDQGMLSLSANISIAYRLIEHWFDGDDAGTLKRIIKARRGGIS